MRDELSQLEHSLIAWACEHFPECADAMSDNWHNPDYVHRCCGSIFRRVCRHSLAYLWTCVDQCPDELLKLSSQIGTVAGFPGGLSWKAWCDASRAASAILPHGWHVERSEPPDAGESTGAAVTGVVVGEVGLF